jgi:type 1 glutamine amidotransferase
MASMKTLAKCAVAGLAMFLATDTPLNAAEKLKALIIDGQNNHDWKSGTPVLKWILTESGRFTVEVATTPPGGAKAAEAWAQWRPKFRDFDVLVMNYTGDRWPAATDADFEQYVRQGGGLVVVHAADNAFPEWPEFNEMIGVGGWGGRNEKSGPMIRWRDGQVVRDTAPGAGGTHGAQHEFVVETRAPEHPIMQGLPAKWRHTADELYAKLRGPAKNLTVLATAHDAPDKGGSGENEPILMVIQYGQGRVFHTVLGHGAPQMHGLGFQVTLARGTEWAATGKVTLPPPAAGALTADQAALRPMPKAP